MNTHDNKRGRIAGVLIGALLIILGIGMILTSLFLTTMLGKINRVEQQETLSAEQMREALTETDPVAPTETEMLATEPETVPAAEPELNTDPSEAIEETVPPALIPTETETMETVPVEPNPVIVNILLVGQDRRIHQSRQRSDAMILCTINIQNKTVTLTSFLVTPM